MYRLEDIHSYNEEQKEFLIKCHQLVVSLICAVEMRHESELFIEFIFEKEADAFLDVFLPTVPTFKLEELIDCKKLTLSKADAEVLMSKVEKIKEVLR